MPFSLKGSPSTFQKLMDRVLNICHKYAASYLDDIVTFSKSWKDHLIHIRDVFNRLVTAGFEKCQFAMAECLYLGHVVGKGKVKLEKRKIKAAQNFLVPKTKKDVRAFLGLVGYYRRFIPNFSEKSACHSDLTEPSTKQGSMTTRAPECIQSLKKSL